MIQVNAACPSCGASLMDESHPIDGSPAILTWVDLGGERVELRLSSVLGNYSIACEGEIAEGREVVFHCPHCDQSLTGTRTCDLCSASMAHFRMREGGGIQVCCRRGCRKHLIEFENPETEVSEFYRNNPIFWDAYHPPKK
jgi:hypothetical protein